MRAMADAVKRGVWAESGFSLEIMTNSLGEELTMPTSMLYRNLLAMDVEEMVRLNPCTASHCFVVATETIPARPMSTAIMDISELKVPGGPMLSGMWKNQPCGCGTDIWKCGDDTHAGGLSEVQWQELERAMLRGPGQCMTMGTASTVTSVAEASGMTLLGCAGIPAAEAQRLKMPFEYPRRLADPQSR